MCDLLVTHPYFNYADNIAQVVVPFLNNQRPTVREIVKNCCKTVFKEDKREQITLKILQVLNQHLKKHAHNVHVDMLDILLALKIKEVNLDQEKQHELKEKKLQSHRSNVLQLSKNERKVCAAFHTFYDILFVIFHTCRERNVWYSWKRNF